MGHERRRQCRVVASEEEAPCPGEPTASLTHGARRPAGAKPDTSAQLTRASSRANNNCSPGKQQFKTRNSITIFRGAFWASLGARRTGLLNLFSPPKAWGSASSRARSPGACLIMRCPNKDFHHLYSASPPQAGPAREWLGRRRAH